MAFRGRGLGCTPQSTGQCRYHSWPVLLAHSSPRLVLSCKATALVANQRLNTSCQASIGMWRRMLRGKPFFSLTSTPTIGSTQPSPPPCHCWSFFFRQTFSMAVRLWHLAGVVTRELRPSYLGNEGNLTKRGDLSPFPGATWGGHFPARHPDAHLFLVLSPTSWDIVAPRRRDSDKRW